MTKILEFIKPASELQTWAIRHGLIILVCFFVLWLLCFIFARARFMEETDDLLRVYFGCQIPLLILNILASALFLITASQYKQSGVNLPYTLPYLGAAIIAWCCVLQLSGKIKRRINHKERMGIK